MSKRSSSPVRPLVKLPEVLFVEDVARVLRCSPSTIRRRLRGGAFPVPRLCGVDNRPRFSRVAFETWLGRDGRRKL